MGTKRCWRAGVRNIRYAYFHAKTPFHTALLPRHDKEKSRHVFFCVRLALFTRGISQHEIIIHPTVFILIYNPGHVVNDLCFLRPSFLGSIVILHNSVNSRWIQSRPTMYFFLIEYSVLYRKICSESSSMLTFYMLFKYVSSDHL